MAGFSGRLLFGVGVMSQPASGGSERKTLSPFEFCEMCNIDCAANGSSDRLLFGWRDVTTCIGPWGGTEMHAFQLCTIKFLQALPFKN